jgi:hypothetical protein
MTRLTDTASRTSTLVPDAAPAETAAERPSENLSIFSAPALEVVFQWWLESNRRWTERDRNRSHAV